MILDYEALVAQYTEGLHNQLRSFSTGHAFLETWVPDESVTRSLFGIFEAADVARLSGRLDVRLSPALAAQVDQSWLSRETGSFGDLEVEARADGTWFRFTFGKGDPASARFGNFHQAGQGKGGAQAERGRTSDSRLPSLEERFAANRTREPSDAHPAYREKLLQAAVKPLREGDLPLGVGKHRVEARRDGVALSLALDARTVIVAARHRGARGLNRAVLDGFCLVIEGLPVQEASDHGVIRLERALRSPTASAPVSGILTPENAEAAFATPTWLMREAYRSWLGLSGQAPRRNFWTDPLPSAWIQAPFEERARRVSETLTAALEQAGLPREAVAVREIQRDTRVVLSLSGREAERAVAPALLRLERALRDRLGVPLELFLVEREDSNKPREQNVKEKTERPVTSAP